MKSIVLQRFLCVKSMVAAAWLLSFLPGSLRAGIWVEGPGDAGELPATAQTTRGQGLLTAISGRLDRTFADIDLFAIEISDPAAFSATTVNGNTVLFDTQLVLFDSQGLGIIASDDADVASGELLSTIPPGSVTVAGSYYLAIGIPLDIARSSAGSIFPDSFPDWPWGDTLVGPTGAGGALAVTHWDKTHRLPDPSGAEAYEIRLTGVRFAQKATPVPEPSGMAAFALLAACGAIIVAVRRNFPRNCGPVTPSESRPETD